LAVRSQEFASRPCRDSRNQPDVSPDYESSETSTYGTWKATNSIKNGDIIRVDGDNGIVDVVKRA